MLKITTIRKYIYKVRKNFTLTDNNQKEIDTSVNNDVAKGSHFTMGDAYVDYANTDDGETVSQITKTLLEGEFLELESQANL